MNAANHPLEVERFRARIFPVRDGLPRPTWSVMIPTYNCARYLGEALQGVLAQDPGPDEMQIEVVDDASQDDPQSVVADVGCGRVGFHRKARNEGHIANFETCLQRSRGRIVHLLHGDDCVRPGFYEALLRGFDAEPRCGAAFCRQVFVDGRGTPLSLSPMEEPKSGLLPDALARLASEQRIMTPSIAVRREVYERLGGFDRRLTCAEDWEMWVRIAASYPVWYEPEPLALYRMHPDSNTGRHVRSAEDMSFTRRAIGIFRNYLPQDRAGEIVARARAAYAAAALDTAETLLRNGDRAGSLAQMAEALRFRVSPATVARMARLLIKNGARLAQAR